MKFHPYAKLAAAVFLVHLVQYLSDQTYYRFCSRNLFWALFTRHSPMCSALRTTSDVFAGSFQKFLAGSFVVALHHPLNQLLEGGARAPAEPIASP
jgi:hypothetical protein